MIKKNKQNDLRKLISRLLFYYPKDESFLFERLKKIYQHLNKQKRSHLAFFEANKRFKLIEKEGPLIIAQNILDTEKDISVEVLPQIWLKENHLQQGIGKKILERLCELTKEPIQKENKAIVNRFLQYVSGGGRDYQNKRFFDVHPIVSALLLPFEKKTPGQLIKNEITQFLDSHIGDPRAKSEKWINMGKEKSIFLRWKIGETLKDFFALLSYTAEKNSSADRMWPYRKEFIKAYWEEGHILDAWIVLGKEANENKSKFLKEGLTNYGIITRGSNRFHSALLFKIGELVLSEWNYNGRVRVWMSNNRHAPKFYEKKYLRDDLVAFPEFELNHYGAEDYSWQFKLSTHIEKYTSIACPKYLQSKINNY